MVSLRKLFLAAALVFATAAAPAPLPAPVTEISSDIVSRDLKGAQIGSGNNLVRLILAFSVPPAFFPVSQDIGSIFTRDIAPNLFAEFGMDIGSWLAIHADSAYSVWNAATNSQFGNAIAQDLRLSAAGPNTIEFLYQFDLHLAGTMANAVYRQALITGLQDWCRAVGITAAVVPLAKRDLDPEGSFHHHWTTDNVEREAAALSRMTKRAPTCPTKQPYGPGIYRYASGEPKQLDRAPSTPVCAWVK